MTRSLPILGVFSAALTPFRDDLSVDTPELIGHCRRLLGAGCDGVALLGTTGEANSLSARERMDTLAAVAAEVTPEKLVPGTGVCSITESIDLTRHAMSLGVRTVLLLPPFYYKGVSEAGLLDFYTRVIEGVGDGVRVLLYHIPQFTQITMSHDMIATLRERFPGVVIGIKDSSGDLEHMKALMARFDDFSVLAGADHLLGPLLRAGGAGCVTATSNLIAADLKAVFDGVSAGTDTADTEAFIGATRSLFQAWPQIPAIRRMVSVLRNKPQWASPRPPFMPLTEAEGADMLTAATKLTRPGQTGSDLQTLFPMFARPEVAA